MKKLLPIAASVALAAFAAGCGGRTRPRTRAPANPPPSPCCPRGAWR